MQNHFNPEVESLNESEEITLFREVGKLLQSHFIIFLLFVIPLKPVSATFSHREFFEERDTSTESTLNVSDNIPMGFPKKSFSPQTLLLEQKAGEDKTEKWILPAEESRDYILSSRYGAS